MWRMDKMNIWLGCCKVYYTRAWGRVGLRDAVVPEGEHTVEATGGPPTIIKPELVAQHRDSGNRDVKCCPQEDDHSMCGENDPLLPGA